MDADLETLRARVAGHRNWWHRIELAPGLVTPGVQDSAEVLGQLDALGLPRVATGLRVLDVGCRDGAFAFEMERRGASVVALDYADPTLTGFSIVAEALRSNVEYRLANVYELSPERHGTFDVVLFLGVLYHLRNPMLALDGVRSVTRPGGLVFVETRVCTEPALAGLDVPVWRFYPGDALDGDETNKWAPNLAGLRSVVQECQLDVLETVVVNDRAALKARSIENPQLDYYRTLDGGTDIWGRGGRPVD